tara:strand:+ start:1826 stop:2395 length:570 start_codon:yes stop_codon:yes gene_type:complete
MTTKMTITTDSLEKQIESQIREWSRFSLEKKHGKSLPMCPYAENTWNNDKVSIQFAYKDYTKKLKSIQETWNDTYDVIILACFDFENDPDAFQNTLDGINENASNTNLWVMGFSPHCYGGIFEANPKTPPSSYAMIFIQRLAKLQEAAYELQDLGYYKEYESQVMHENREVAYKKLINGEGYSVARKPS